MPLFRKQSSAKKKKLQHQLYLARESPENTFDISGCELTDIPQGVYSLCKVLRKEALLGHDNWLTSLKGGGQLSDLSKIRILDLHSNDLTEIPDEISQLQCLQVLNLQNNKLKHLPQSVAQLSVLQTLNLADNKLHELPECICHLRQLRTLVLSRNRIRKLPSSLCHVRTLDTLVIDADHMESPPAGVCREGTEAIMKFLCSECGQDYTPPSQYLLNVMDAPKSTPPVSSSSDNLRDFSTNSGHISRYETAKENRRQERIALERQLEEDQRAQAEQAAHAAANKQHLIDFVAQDQRRLSNELSSLQQVKDVEHQQMLETLYSAEMDTSQLVEEMLMMNKDARRSEELLERMEKERMEAEQWFVVQQEETESLRRKDVLAAMEEILAEDAAFDEVINGYLASRDDVIRRAHESAEQNDNHLDNVLTNRDVEQSDLVEKLLHEEKLQKDAFERLQMLKDTKHQRLRDQIQLLEYELGQLSALEVDQRDIQVSTTQNVLVEKRRALTDLLIQLMTERDDREKQLQKRLMEMEDQRLNTQTDYWLVQYQRLMDRKPEGLINRERQLEITVVKILERADASDYVSLFSRHRVTIETMCQLTEADLTQMGVHELGVRKSIMREIEHHRSQERKLTETNPPQKPGVSETEQAAAVAPPKRRPLPTAPSFDITARGVNSECVICMDGLSSALFLPCGHVCCCLKCAKPIAECPLCRASIVQKIKLTHEANLPER